MRLGELAKMMALVAITLAHDFVFFSSSFLSSWGIWVDYLGSKYVGEGSGTGRGVKGWVRKPGRAKTLTTVRLQRLSIITLTLIWHSGNMAGRLRSDPPGINIVQGTSATHTPGI